MAFRLLSPPLPIGSRRARERAHDSIGIVAGDPLQTKRHKRRAVRAVRTAEARLERARGAHRPFRSLFRQARPLTPSRHGGIQIRPPDGQPGPVSGGRQGGSVRHRKKPCGENRHCLKIVGVRGRRPCRAVKAPPPFCPGSRRWGAGRRGGRFPVCGAQPARTAFKAAPESQIRESDFPDLVIPAPPRATEKQFS